MGPPMNLMLKYFNSDRPAKKPRVDEASCSKSTEKLELSSISSVSVKLAHKLAKTKGPMSTPFSVVSHVSGKGKAVMDMSDCAVINSDSLKPAVESGTGLAERAGSNSPELPANVNARRRRTYEMRRHFQDTWGARFPWVEPVVSNNESGDITQVKCVVCSTIEGREKLLVPKIDGLWKHAGRRKAVKDINLKGRLIRSGEYYFLGSNAHVKNERLFAARPVDDVRVQIGSQATIERRKKAVQFKCLLHLMSKGRPMTDYEDLEALCMSLNVPDLPRKHWCDNSGWDMAEALADVVKTKSWAALQEANFVSFSADEVTTPDNQCWLSVHAYVVKDYKRMPMLLALTRNHLGQSAENIHNMVVTGMMYFGNLNAIEVARKTVCFAADGAATFQGCRNGVTALLQRETAPYVNGVHCCAHRTNLAADKLSKLPFVSRIENLCAVLYSYFHKSPKRFAELEALASELEQEGLKIIRNITTRWLSVIDSIQRVLDHIPVLIAKMDQDANSVAAAKSNLDLLLDLPTLLSFPAIMPLLLAVNNLLKFAQDRECYICDFMAAVKLCQAELYSLYLDPATAFSGDSFQKFSDIAGDHTYLFQHDWRTDMNSGEENLCLKIGDYSYECHFFDGASREFVSRSAYEVCLATVKVDCAEAAQLMTAELETRFPNSDLLNALGVVFPQYWMQPEAENHFAGHLAVIKAHYAETRSCPIGDFGKEEVTNISPPLSASALDTQATYFKITMMTNSRLIMEDKSNTVNPLSRLWATLGRSNLVLSRIPQFFKLAELATVTLVGSVEDERTFSNLAFIKNKMRNRLGRNLDPTIKIFAQDFFNLETFPYHEAYDSWRARVKRLGAAY